MADFALGASDPRRKYEYPESWSISEPLTFACHDPPAAPSIIEVRVKIQTHRRACTTITDLLHVSGYSYLSKHHANHASLYTAGLGDQ
jgi:hypothetical protein